MLFKSDTLYEFAIPPDVVMPSHSSQYAKLFITEQLTLAFQVRLMPSMPYFSGLPLLSVARTPQFSKLNLVLAPVFENPTKPPHHGAVPPTFVTFITTESSTKQF